MYLLLIGLVGLALKYLEIGPVATLSWWMVLIPLPLALVGVGRQHRLHQEKGNGKDGPAQGRTH